MTESKRRPRGLKGAVLIMVLTILFVLMVMLLATLAIVSSTTARSYTKFVENQTYYTARSVLEVYIDEFLEDNTPYSGSSSDVINLLTSKGPFDAVEYLDEDGITWKTGMKNNKDFIGKTISNGFVHQQEIFNVLKPKYQYNPLDSSYPAEVLNDDANNLHWELLESNKDKCFVEFDATVPKMSNITVTTATDGAAGLGELDSDQKVRIKIELMRILYKDQNGLPLDDCSDSFTYKSKFKDSGAYMGNLSTAKERAYGIDWERTYYRIKVTSTADLTINGNKNEVSVSVMLEPNPYHKNPSTAMGFNNAMTSFSTSSTANHVFSIGGASANQPKQDISIRGSTVLHGTEIYRGNMFIETSSNLNIQENGQVVVQDGVIHSKNGFVFKGGTDTSADKTKRPFIYSNGILLGSASGQQVGTSNRQVDLFVSTNIDPSRRSKMNLISDLSSNSNSSYSLPDSVNGVALDKDKVAFATGGNPTTVNGDIYCDGDMYLAGNSMEFNGNIYCTGTIFIDGNAANNVTKFLKGDVYCKNVVVKDGKDENQYVDSSGSLNVGENDKLNFELKIDNPEAENVKFTNLPEGAVTGGRSEVNVDLINSISNPYSYATNGYSVPDDSKNKTLNNGYSVKVQDDNSTMSARDKLRLMAGSESIALAVSSTAPDAYSKISNKTLHDEKTGKDYSGDCITGGTVNAATGCTEYNLDIKKFENKSGIYYIDATSGPVQIQLQTTAATWGDYAYGNANPTFIVVGDNDVYFTTDDNSNWRSRMSVYTAGIYDAITSGTTLYLGDQPAQADKPPIPHVYYFFGDGSEFETYNSNTNQFCGYMYGPYAKFKQGAGNNTAAVSYKYNSGPDTYSAGNILVYGSMVFGSIESDNEVGAVYLGGGAAGGDDSGGGDDGRGKGGNIHWGRMRFLNN